MTAAYKPLVELSEATSPEQLHVDLHTLTPEIVTATRVGGFWTGSAAFLLRILVWTCFTIVLPIVLSLASVTLPHGVPRAAAIAVPASLGALYLFWGLRQVLAEILCSKPSAESTPYLSNTAQVRKLEVRKIALVYNPFAGRKKAAQVVEKTVIPMLEEARVEVVRYETTHAGHAREVTPQISGVDVIVVVGGDGTLHEVVAALLALPPERRIPVAIIPCGSGNAFMGTLRENYKRCGHEVSFWADIDESARWATEVILSGNAAKVDAAEATISKVKIPIVLEAFFGLLGEVDVAAESLRWLGSARLDVCSIWEVLKMRANRMRITVGEKPAITARCLSFAISLTQHWTDTMRVSPDAKMDDGQGELMYIFAEKTEFSKAPTRGDLIRGFLMLPNGAAKYTVGTLGEILPQNDKVLVEMLGDNGELQNGVLNIDGEIYRHNGRVELQMVPQCWEILVPEDRSQ